MALTIEELKELIQADEHRQLELKKTTGELSEFTNISSLDEKLIRGVVRLGVERGRLSDLALTEPIEDVLGKWKLTTDNKPLNAATTDYTREYSSATYLISIQPAYC